MVIFASLLLLDCDLFACIFVINRQQTVTIESLMADCLVFPSNGLYWSITLVSIRLMREMRKYEC